MSLEDKIEALTWAVDALTKAIGGMQAPAPVGVPLKFDDKVELPKTTLIHEIPNEKSSPTTDTSQTSAEESPKVVYNDVAKLVTQIAKTDLLKAKAALSRLGVKHGKELTEAQWPEAVAYLTRVANGEVNPEDSHA